MLRRGPCKNDVLHMYTGANLTFYQEQNFLDSPGSKIFSDFIFIHMEIEHPILHNESYSKNSFLRESLSDISTFTREHKAQKCCVHIKKNIL